MIYIQHPLNCLTCPLVNILLAASAAYSAIAAEMNENVFIAVGAVVVEVSLAWVVAEKHRIDFSGLFFP